MGWGTGDEERVQAAQVQTSLARQQFYKLKTVLDKINHAEKRDNMLRICDEIYERLDRLDYHLHR